MLLQSLITGIISSPFILHNIRANATTKYLIEHGKFDPLKKISITKGILRGTQFKTITSLSRDIFNGNRFKTITKDDFVVNKLIIYKGTVMHTNSVLGLALLFCMFNDNDVEPDVVLESRETITRFSPDLKFAGKAIDTSCVIDIFCDEENGYPRQVATRVPTKEFPFSKFQEFGLKDDSEVYLFKETVSTKTKLIIADLNSRKKLENYVATEYYKKIHYAWIIVIVVLAFILAEIIVFLFFENQR